MIRNYVTVKAAEKYFRIIRVDEGGDDSVYIIRRIGKRWTGKYSFHHGRVSGDGKHFGYQRHQKIRDKLVSDSVRYSATRLQDKRQVFFVFHYDELPATSEIPLSELNSADLIFEAEAPISLYEILVSVNRHDLTVPSQFIQTQKCAVRSGDFYVTLYQKNSSNGQ